jgi:hypothetical protein
MTSKEAELDDILDSALEEQFVDDPVVDDCVDVSDTEENDKKVIEIPKDFAKLISDFINDVATTFPEYKPIIQKWWGFDSYTGTQLASLFSHCMKVYPARFTDIIYQKEDIFDANSNDNVDFLPGISFKYLWSCNDITDATREVIWKYLQTITICVVGSIDSNNMDKTMKEVFDKLDEDTFKDNLCETIDQIQGIFKKATDTLDTQDDVDADADTDATPNISADTFQANLDNLIGGKIGSLAEEIMKETVENLNEDDFAGAENPSDILKKLFENPGSLISMAQGVTQKLQSKIDSGEYNQEDLFNEASDVLKNVKNMPGGEMIQNMMSNLARSQTGGGGDGEDGMPDLGDLMATMLNGGGLKKGQRVDTNALNRQVKRKNQITEMKKRAEQRRTQQAAAMMAQQLAEASAPATPLLTDDEIVAMIEGDENQKEVKTSSKKKKSKNKK